MFSVVTKSRSIPWMVLVNLRRTQSLSSSFVLKQLNEPHWLAGSKLEYDAGGRNCVRRLYGWNCQQRVLHTGKVFLGKVISFDLPDVGEAIQTVEVKEWLVNVGDVVSLGDSVCEVQSDKSAVVIYSPYDGVVRELMYEVGDIATKGKPVVMIEVEEEGVQEGPKTDTPPPTPSDEILVMPAVRTLALENSVNLSEVKGTGKNGRILKEDILNFVQSVSSKVSDVVSDVAACMRPLESSEKSSRMVLATPAVRHMAKKDGVNLNEVQGTGKGGHVLKEDLVRHIKDASRGQATPISTPPVSDVLSEGDRIKMIKGFKSIMVKTMTMSGQIPQFGYCDEVDMSRLVSLRSSLKKLLEEEGLRFSYMPIIIKAVSNVLKEFPILNAIVDADCTSITYKADHNIGIAMDTPEGLVVPNVKQVQNRSILEITMELNRLQDLGMKGMLSLSDIRSGTFSLSNIGAIGGTYSRPLCLPPQVAIGAFGKVHVLPRFNSSGDLYSAHVMHASWSADHRVIDGATMARFSNKWKALVEEPSNMISELHSSLTNEKSLLDKSAS